MHIAVLIGIQVILQVIMEIHQSRVFLKSKPHHEFRIPMITNVQHCIFR